MLLVLCTRVSTTIPFQCETLRGMPHLASDIAVARVSSSPLVSQGSLKKGVERDQFDFIRLNIDHPELLPVGTAYGCAGQHRL